MAVVAPFALAAVIVGMSGVEAGVDVPLYFFAWLAMLPSIWLLKDRLERTFGRTADDGRPRRRRFLIGALVGAVGALTMQLALRVDLPFSPVALVGALLFFWTWWKTGCVGRHRLVAGIAVGLAAILLPTSTTGSAAYVVSRALAQPAVVFLSASMVVVAVLDYLLLLDLRDLAATVLSEPTE